MTSDSLNGPCIVVVEGSQETVIHSYKDRLQRAFASIDPSVQVQTVISQSSSASGNAVLVDPLIGIRSPFDRRLIFSGPLSDYEIQLIALAIRARRASRWFEETLERIDQEAGALLRRHAEPERDDYVTGYLLSLFHHLRNQAIENGTKIELIDILRPAWLEGHSTSVLFVVMVGTNPGQVNFCFGSPETGGQWTWGEVMPLSRSTHIEINVHEVQETTRPVEERRFATIRNLSDSSDLVVQMLLESEDFERLVNSINRFRRGELVLEDVGSESEEPQLSREEAFEQARKELDELVGLAEVKQSVTEFVNFVQVSQRRAANGFDPGDISTHFVFSGSPGTGKTTVARIIARILYGLGLLSGYSTKEVLRADLVAGFVGQTAIKTKEIIDESLGGVLFIDEAYSLTEREGNDFGSEAVETLLAEMENNRHDLCVIAAGYQDKMENFLSSNPGIRSRFSRTIFFPDYSPDELVEIFRRITAKNGLTLAPGVEEKVDAYFTSARAAEQFGNARAVRQLVEDSIVRQSNRVAGLLETLSVEELQTLTPDDIALPESSSNSRDIDEEGLQKSLADLDALVGLRGVKETIKSFVDLAKGQILRREAGLKNQTPTLSFVFQGPSGTGKTTVARLLGRIFLNLGLLNRGQTIEVTRADLVAGYVGQTAIKTREVVGRALDGVLFIDEAYSLSAEDGTGNDFGAEAIQELLTQMENNRSRLSIVFAGYEAEMQAFLDSNPGLRNRVGEVLEFESYSPDDLCEIFARLARGAGYGIPVAVKADMKAYFTGLLEVENFGQARAARNLLDKAILAHSRRLSSVDIPQQSQLESLSINDIRIAMGIEPITESAEAMTIDPVINETPGSTQISGVADLGRTSNISDDDEIPQTSQRGHIYVLDGSNIAMEGGRTLYGQRICSLRLLREARDAIKERFNTENVHVVVDATFRHKVHDSEKDAANAALNSREFMQPPAGAIGKGDALLLEIADGLNGIVVSNDSFSKPGETFLTNYPWLFHEGRVLGHNYVAGAGWIFTPRRLR